MGIYHSKLLMLFNLAFLMKCKYEGNQDEKYRDVVNLSD